jgi:hypothetical protein
MARQGELFPSGRIGLGSPSGPALPLLARQLIDWQQRLADFQRPLFTGVAALPRQASLFDGDLPGDLQEGEDRVDPLPDACALNPLLLQAQSLAFWRWPAAPQQGAALYFVTDRCLEPAADLLLYVGETGQAARRWKGDHDCKNYLAAYSEALAKAQLPSQLSIRFWLDVPRAIRPRRALEQALIRRWLPPFNKETRQRWATPFTSGDEP